MKWTKADDALLKEYIHDQSVLQVAARVKQERRAGRGRFRLAMLDFPPVRAAVTEQPVEPPPAASAEGSLTSSGWWADILKAAGVLLVIFLLMQVEGCPWQNL